MEASNAILVVEYKQPDLIVTGITPNCGYLFANESNEISATVKNNGSADAGAFNVSFVIDGFSATASVSTLGAGNDTEVSITDLPLRTAGDSVTITITADCNGDVSESNETNNVTVQEETVMNNGYKGKRYTGGSDITTWQTIELQGDLLYSVGDSQYFSGSSTPWTTYTVNWTVGDLPVPGPATVKEARLYVNYNWDKVDGMPDNVSLSFNGVAQTRDAFYTDRKGYASSNYPCGMLVYDVTADFSTGGDTAILTNLNPVKGNPSLRGMLLVVIYEDATEPLRAILVNEEYDYLYGASSKCTTPDEATAYAPFAGSFELSTVNSAQLITVAPSAGPNEGELLFNGQIWTNVWNFAGSSQIGIDDRDVKAYLATTNEAGFQSSADYMEASNAILVLEYEPSKSKRGGGGAYTATDSDGDGYSDIEEILAGTDPNNADDYPHKSAVTPASAPTITPTPKPTMSPVPTPVVTPVAPPASATPTPTPEEPGFEAICAIACLLAIAYVALRKRN
jgi:hypothetical protein